MQQNRRTFLMGAGMVGAMAAIGDVAQAQVPDSSNVAHGMAHGLTLLTMRHQGEYRLGVKTDKGILDVNGVAELLNMHAPGTMDDLLQHEDGPSLSALVNVASKHANSQAASLTAERAAEREWAEDLLPTDDRPLVRKVDRWL